MTRIVAHRGARNLWPENSLSGFRKAAKLGADAVELDIHVTTAGEIVVLHDPSLDRTTHGSGDVAALTPAARREIHLRDSRDETIPLFEEVLEIYKGTGMEMHVELKNTITGDLYEGLAGRAIDAIRNAGMVDQCILTGFTRQALEEVRQLAPDFRRLASMAPFSAVVLGGLEPAIRYLDEVADLIAIEKALMQAAWERITAIIPPERLCVWTVNSEPELAYWLATDIGHLTSDRPDLAIEIRNDLRA